MPASLQEAADSRSTLSEADAFEPGSIPTTAHRCYIVLYSPHTISNCMIAI